MAPGGGHTREEGTEPLDEWVERVIDRALAKHALLCPLFGRVRKLEGRWLLGLGMLIGSGILTGGAVAALVKVLGG